MICAKLKFQEEKLNGFFQERLINRKVGFLDKIKKKQSQD